MLTLTLTSLASGWQSSCPPPASRPRQWLCFGLILQQIDITEANRSWLWKVGLSEWKFFCLWWCGNCRSVGLLVVKSRFSFYEKRFFEVVPLIYESCVENRVVYWWKAAVLRGACCVRDFPNFYFYFFVLFSDWNKYLIPSAHAGSKGGAVADAQDATPLFRGLVWSDFTSLRKKKKKNTL